MNHIIHNISVVLIFIGIIMLTINLTKSYNKSPGSMSKSGTLLQEKPQELDQEKPSKIYDKMFDRPDIWMGYADFDSKEFKTNRKELIDAIQTRL